MDFSNQIKKKKKKNKEKKQANRDQGYSNPSVAVDESHIEADSDRDYTYDELLTRVVDIMRDKNPDMVAKKEQKFVMQPLKVVQTETKNTNIVNFTKIYKTLPRQPNKPLLNFLLAELGTSVSVKGKKNLIIKGHFQEKQIENVLRRYIKEYVTCHTCGSPDTILQKDTRLFFLQKATYRFLQCETCGSRCSVASNNSGFQVCWSRCRMSQSKRLLYRKEDEFYDSLLSNEEDRFLKKVSIPKWLENAESPFKWLKSLRRNLHISPRLHKILTDKFPDYKNQGSDYGFEKYALLLTLTCIDLIFFSKLKFKEVGTQFSLWWDIFLLEQDEDLLTEDEIEPIDPEKMYKDLEQVVEEMRSREGDVMYSRIGAALEHVLTATRANMLHLQGRDEESKQAAKNLVPVENMSSENKAGFKGIKAKFTVHMVKDMTVALKAAKKAIELDPDFAYWKYLAAKVMRRHRRCLGLEMEPEELEFFEHAVALERNPKFLVFLAQANQEVVINTYSGNGGVQSEDPEQLVERAVQLYRECWKLKNDSAAIARRVGNGILKMRGEHFDFKLAKEALHKAVEISPNTVTYHALGKLYLYYAHDEEKALKYFESIKGMYGTGELIRYKLINDPNSDISEHIEYWILIADGLVKADIYYCDIGWYYLCIQPDINKAVHFFWKILKKDSNCFRVLNFTSYAFVVKGTFNMLEVLVNEVLLALKRYSQKPEFSKQRDHLNDFLEKIYEKHPHLREITPDCDLLPELKKSVLNDLAKLKRRMYGRTNSGFGRRNNRGNWKPVSQNQAEENRMERRDNTVTNWRSESRTEDEHGSSSNQSGRNRNRLSSGEYGETSREMNSYTRRRGDSESEEQNRGGRRWNERYDRYNQQNMGNNNTQRSGQHGQRERTQNDNSRYDTTVTNWRTENRS